MLRKRDTLLELTPNEDLYFGEFVSYTGEWGTSMGSTEPKYYFDDLVNLFAKWDRAKGKRKITQKEVMGWVEKARASYV